MKINVLCCFLFVLAEAGCTAHRQVDVGQVGEIRELTSNASPTPVADELFLQRAQSDKLELATTMYAEWLEQRHDLFGVATMDDKEVESLALSHAWNAEDAHVLLRLSMVFYYKGIVQARSRSDSLEYYERAKNWALATVCINETVQARMAAGFDLRDLTDVLRFEDHPGVSWYLGAWVRTGEVRGVVASLRSIAHLIVLYEWMIEQKPDYWGSSPHMAMGGIYSLLPRSMGGDIELGKRHFERAMELAPEYLESKVLYAEYYLLPQGQRQPFEELIDEIISTQIDPGLFELDNELAQQRATELKENIDKLF